MADQADFPDNYIDSSVEAGGVGSEADPYSAFSEINWTTDGDNSIFDYYAGGPAASVTINLKRGETWREFFISGHGGDSVFPIMVNGYGEGSNPLVYGSIAGVSDAYKWTASGSGTNEWYLEAAAGGDPGIGLPNAVWINGYPCGFGSAGSLADHEFEYVDNDELGYSTVYLRDNSGDPDTSGVSIEISNNENNAIFYLKHSYMTVDGIDCMYSNGHGFRLTGEGTNIVVKNCNPTYNFYAGIQVYNGADNCGILDCEVAYCFGTNLSVNAPYTDPVLNLRISGCDIHDPFPYFMGGAYWEACGIKAFGLSTSVIEKTSWYNCLSGGIRFDGTGNGEGCTNNRVAENDVYNCGGIIGQKYPQIELEFADNNTVEHNYLHDPWGGGDNIRVSHASSGTKVINNVLTGATTGSAVTNYIEAGASPTEIIGNSIYGCYYGISNNIEHGLVIKNNAFDGCLYANIRVGSGYSDIDSNNNILGPVVNAPGFKSFRENYTSYTLSEWKVYAGTDANSVEEDPLFTDPDNDDLSIPSGSPCVGAADNTLGSEYSVGLLDGSTWPDDVRTADRDG